MPPSRLDRQRAALKRLANQIAEQDRVLDLLLAQLEELGIRIQFVMETFSIAQKSPIAGVNGEQASRVMSLAQHYEANREKFLAHLKARADHVQGLREAVESAAAADHDSRDGGAGALAPAHGNGHAPDTDAHADASAPDGGDLLPFRRGGVTLN